MDGKSDLLTRIPINLAAYNDDALAALASTGLLRRAQKDLENTVPEVIGEVDGKLRIKFGEALVAVNEVPNQSTCDCPAGGICRHIIATLIFLRESTGEPILDASCEEEILSFDEESLQKWAGTPLLRRAIQKIAQGMEVKIEDESPVLFTIPALNVTCRWMPGGGLSGMVCSCHTTNICEHRAIAVLSYKASKGMLVFEEESRSLEVSPGAPRTREEILASVRNVVHEVIANGISRVSFSTEQRLRTLAVSAHGVDLPRLERLLRVLADEVLLYLNRDARADIRNLLNAAAMVEALCGALEHPTSFAIGIHRSQYEPIGNIELIGLGARRWRSRSGYAGLTVYFWDKSTSNWATWTDARPLTVGTFDGLARYRQAGPWDGCVDPAQASRSQIRLSGAWRNAVGRLSGRSSSGALVLGKSDIPGFPYIERWTDLTDNIYRIFGGGLGEHDERDEIVLLRPAVWGSMSFDEIRQEMVWPVFDADNRELMLLLPHNPETADAMKSLERISKKSPQSVLGILQISAGRLVVEPIALHEINGQVNLTLDDIPRESVSKSQVSTQADDLDESVDENPLPDTSTTSLGLLLTSVESELEEIAESGVLVIRDTTTFDGLISRMDALGLSSCSHSLKRILDLLKKPRSETLNEDSIAEALLKAYYICRLASTQDLIMCLM